MNNNEKTIKFLLISQLFLCCYSCSLDNGNNNNYNSLSNKNNCTNNDTIISSYNPPEDMDSTAIANIHLNISKDEFEKEKRIFLSNHQKLGGLQIKSVDGFFYDNRLAAIQIVSIQHTFHKERMKLYEQEKNCIIRDIQGNGWEYLYNKKYNLGNYYIHIDDENEISYKYRRGRVGIFVSDYCASNLPYSSFKDIMESPLRLCNSGTKSLIPAREIKGDMDARWHIPAIIMNLPKHRANVYNNILRNKLSSQSKLDNGERLLSLISYKEEYQKIYDAAKDEINENIKRHNERIYKSHKNAPSYSIIIIIFIPAKDNYNKFIRDKYMEKIEEKQIKEQQELDII